MRFLLEQLRPGLVVAGMFAAVISAADAQDRERDPQRIYMSRPELTQLLDWYESSAASPVYSAELQARAERVAGNIRTRLEEGDFQVGDRIPIVVDGEAELTDTFTVAVGRVLRFGEVGELQLAGVLRYELDERLEEFLSQFLRQPSFTSQPLIRVTIEGAVGQPGFYNLPSETPLPDVLMMAGGPAGNARLQDLRIVRGDQPVWGGDRLRRALAEGRTLDQLGLRAGDRIILPQTFPLGNAQGAIRTFAMILAIPLSIAALFAIFN